MNWGTIEIEQLGSEATRAITPLREHRAALTSISITGKTDMRDIMPIAEAVA